MNTELRKIPFTEALLPRVIGFNCGNHLGSWCGDVSDWIQSRDGALSAMQKWKTKVWLYENGDGELVGYGSFGVTRWEWPDITSPRRYVGHIPYIGLAHTFYGQPSGPKEDRFATRILKDLIGEAEDAVRANPTIEPVVTLFVHQENKRAISFYEYWGFVPYAEKCTEAENDGFKNFGMVYRLNVTPPPAQESPPAGTPRAS